MLIFYLDGTWTVSGCNIGSVSWICNDTLIVNGDFIVQVQIFFSYFLRSVVRESNVMLNVMRQFRLCHTVKQILLIKPNHSFFLQIEGQVSREILIEP